MNSKLKIFLFVCFTIILIKYLLFFNNERFFPSNSFEAIDYHEETPIFPEVYVKEMDNNFGELRLINVISNKNTDDEISTMKKIVENFLKEYYPEIVLNFIIEYKKSKILLVKNKQEEQVSTSSSEEILYSFYLNIFSGKNPELWNLNILVVNDSFKPVSFKKESYIKKNYKANEEIDKLFRIKNSLGLLSYSTSQSEMDFVDYNGKSVNEWLNIKEKNVL